MSVLMQYGNLSVSHGVAETPDSRHFERHCHKDYELLFVARGQGKYVIDGVEYPLSDGTLMLIHPFEFHYVCPDSCRPYERFVVMFEKSDLIEQAGKLSFLDPTAEGHGNCVYFDENGVTEPIRRAFDEIREIPELFDVHSEEARSMLKLTLSRILLLLSHSEPQTPAVQEENVIQRVMEYLNVHLTRDISLERIAQHFFISKYYLCHAFRNHTGVSVFTYVNTKRIAIAQRLLANGAPATAVAYQVGFRNYSSFYRAFCNQVGESPVRRRTKEEGTLRVGMRIRPATNSDFDEIRRIYAMARIYMRESGNPDQWKDNYPPDDLIRKDIKEGKSFVCEEAGELLGVFFYAVGEDPTYRKIYDGAWLNAEPYGVIHRIAVASHGRGVASFCFAYALSQCPNLKIDTHADNLPMQRALEKNGFSRCGMIHLENGEERIAFQKTV